MDLLPKALQPLKAMARALFRDDLRVERQDGRLRVVLHNPDRPLVEPPHVGAARREQALLAAMRADLAAVLDELPELREENRQLAFFEQALSATGLRALDNVPPQVIAGALEQFEALVTNWSPEALACLRSKMAVAVQERCPKDDSGYACEAPPSAGPERPPASR